MADDFGVALIGVASKDDLWGCGVRLRRKMVHVVELRNNKNYFILRARVIERV